MTAIRCAYIRYESFKLPKFIKQDEICYGNEFLREEDRLNSKYKYFAYVKWCRLAIYDRNDKIVYEQDEANIIEDDGDYNKFPDDLEIGSYDDFCFSDDEDEVEVIEENIPDIEIIEENIPDEED